MNAKFSILSFPQRWEENKLVIRALVMPRNFNPLFPNVVEVNTPAWVDSTIGLTARLISDPDVYPSLTVTPEPFKFSDAETAMPPGVGSIFTAIEQQLGGISDTTRLQKPVPNDRARKYLPESYRSSFNFTQVKNKDASIDDSYHCKIKDSTKKIPGFISKIDMSWGKVFAYCLRQPALAKSVGFIYEASFDVDPELVKNGSWIYIDFDERCSYHDAMELDQQLVKRYAARLPKLKAGVSRQLFAAIQFPVLIKAPVPEDMLSEDIPLVPSQFDELILEAVQYDDGFCKIVHANQPVSSDLLREKEDKELPVITDAGIRLAWDDEQVLTWMNRQIKPDPQFADPRRTDAPMGIMQYRVDVREVNEGVPDNWVPLCRIKNKGDLNLGGVIIDRANLEIETGVEVYPSKPDGDENSEFWLPQYFAQWIGKSLVLPDRDAINIFKKDQTNDPLKKVNPQDRYEAAGLDDFKLLYGHNYEFRIRLADIAGGGPELNDQRIYDGARPEGKCNFRRRVQPQAIRLQNALPTSDDVYFEDEQILMKRPLLGYPSVLYTGHYPNAVQDLINDGDIAIAEKRVVGLPDPDVEAVEIIVEVKALEMDMLLRHNHDSKESYAKLYIAKRLFPADMQGDLSVSITYVDAPVLMFTDSDNLGDLGLVANGENINDINEIVLPSSRDIRITIVPVVAQKDNYYATDSVLHKKGKPISFITRRDSKNERDLFKSTGNEDMIRGLWLQPDSNDYLKASNTKIFVEQLAVAGESKIMERLVSAIDQSIDVEAKGMSLVGKMGSRIQFGASRLIRNNLSPDSTSITISTKSDLFNQWIIPVTLLLNRDWTWDGFKPVSIQFFRKKKWVGRGQSIEERDLIEWGEEEFVGDVEFKQTINIQSLYNPDRSQTGICFLDALEPKPEKTSDFPEELMVQYSVRPIFNHSEEPEKDDPLELTLHLPVTTKPAQMPKIVSAGIAQSEYRHDEMYANTDPRRRYLWIEFDQPLDDVNDAYFIRMLAYSPDPLLAQWTTDMMKAPKEPDLPLNPEPVRMISPLHSDDRAGLNAMQELVQADDSKVHYLVPLPPGLHASSAELFGFFTYEIRVGHKVGWNTAQARFGRALRTTGVQHPAPQLFCTVNRNEKHIMVTAPFAQTVFNGSDATSNPPRTQLWALLYAQVKRADGEANRNILLDDQLLIRQRKNFQQVVINSDAVQYGITGWRNKDVTQMLNALGLPIDCNLSVLVVEMLPTYDKFFAKQESTRGQRFTSSMQVFDLEKGMNITHFRSMMQESGRLAMERQFELETDLQSRIEEGIISQADKEEQLRPLTDHLGTQRILRTSTLVAVPEVCCTE